MYGRGWGLERISISLQMQPESVVRALYRYRVWLLDPADREYDPRAVPALDRMLVPLNREREVVRWAARSAEQRALRAEGKRAWRRAHRRAA
jgi:hypothetical protein